MIIKATKQIKGFKRKGVNIFIPKSNNSIGPTVAGLYGIRYNGYFSDNVNWFQTAALHGEVNQLTEINNFTSDADNYSWEWIGYFTPSSTENYTFYLNSDDASYLWIGSKAKNGYTKSNATVDNGGLHGPNEEAGSVALNAGVLYPIRIQFGENAGGDFLTVSFSTPTIPKRTNANGYFSYVQLTNGF